MVNDRWDAAGNKYLSTRHSHLLAVQVHIPCVCPELSVREPSSLRFVRQFSKASLRLVSEKDSALDIFGQNVQMDGTLFFADSQNQQMKCLDVQTGAFHVVFAEAEPGWVVCNSRLLDSRHADILVVSERNNKVSRVVIAKKNTCGHYVTDHAVILDETSWVSLHITVCMWWVL